jgi:hypothetical protein
MLDVLGERDLVLAHDAAKDEDRAQSRAHVLRPAQGAFVISPTRERPRRGKNGWHRVGLRHRVSTVTRGSRTALGVILHDAA